MKKQKHSRVRFARARLAVSKEAGVESFKGPQQQRFGQCLVHRLLAGKGGVTLIHRAKGEVISEGVALFWVRVLDNSLLTVHEDDLQRLLCLLPVTEQKYLRFVSDLSTFISHHTSKMYVPVMFHLSNTLKLNTIITNSYWYLVEWIRWHLQGAQQ